ncbi:hypothetical protein [Pseudotamlana carrageenivorans]|uniref:hypothetical protein n=1 Tax=Pseudotamlana carrageenivorans TaxID=2069432 RepID=UPI0026C48C15
MKNFRKEILGLLLIAFISVNATCQEKTSSATDSKAKTEKKSKKKKKEKVRK